MDSSQTRKRKLNHKTIAEKYAAIKEVESGALKKVVAAKYGIPHNTLSTWIKNKLSIINSYEQLGSGVFAGMKKRLRLGLHKTLDQALYTWAIEKRCQGVIIHEYILKQKALDFAREIGIREEEFRASNGWLHRWKKRFAFSCRVVSKESKGGIHDRIITVSRQEPILPTILYQYSPENIFNADEFKLFYGQLSIGTKSKKSAACIYGKCSKLRLTGMAAANARGERLPMFIIGNSENLKYFEGIRAIPCRCRWERRSLLSTTLFEEWVRELDKQFARQGKEICLIVDDSPAHCKVAGLTNIRLLFLAQNTKLKCQGMGRGVIRNLKANYRRRLVKKFVQSLREGRGIPKISVLDAMFMLILAWEEVSPATVINFFKKSGIASFAQDVTEANADDPFKSITEDLTELTDLVPDLLPSGTNADDIVNFDEDTSLAKCISTDQDISSWATEKDDEDDEDDEVVADDNFVVCPTFNHVFGAVDTIRYYSLFSQNGADMLKICDKLEGLVHKDYVQDKKVENCL